MKKLLLLFSLLVALSGMSQDTPRVVQLNESNTVVLDTDYNDISVANLQQNIFNKILVKNPPKDIYLVLNSPGGSVSAGKLLIDTINALDVNVHTITINAMSMGYNTVQGLKKSKRLILPSGTLMSHRAAVRGVGGQFPGELDTRVKMLHDSVVKMDEIAAKRVNLSIEEYQSLIRDEYWVIGEDAVKSGHADEVVLAKCSEGMMTTKEESIFFFGVEIVLTMSNCPLITGPLSFEIRQSHMFSNDQIQAVNEAVRNKFKIRNTGYSF